MGVEMTAKELPRLGLADALELTLLIARKDPRRHPRVAARCLRRYLEAHPQVTIAEAAMAAGCLGGRAANASLEPGDNARPSLPGLQDYERKMRLF
jgi:hypothetical protein